MVDAVPNDGLGKLGGELGSVRIRNSGLGRCWCLHPIGRGSSDMSSLTMRKEPR